MRNKKFLTLGERYQPILYISTQAQAEAFFTRLVEYSKSCGTRADIALALERYRIAAYLATQRRATALEPAKLLALFGVESFAQAKHSLRSALKTSETGKRRTAAA